MSDYSLFTLRKILDRIDFTPYSKSKHGSQDAYIDRHVMPVVKDLNAIFDFGLDQIPRVALRERVIKHMFGGK